MLSFLCLLNWYNVRLPPRRSQYCKRMCGHIFWIENLPANGNTSWISDHSFIMGRFGVGSSSPRLPYIIQDWSTTDLVLGNIAVSAALLFFQTVTITIWCKAICCMAYFEVGWFILGKFTIVCLNLCFKTLIYSLLFLYFYYWYWFAGVAIGGSVGGAVFFQFGGKTLFFYLGIFNFLFAAVFVVLNWAISKCQPDTSYVPRKIALIMCFVVNYRTLLLL